MTASSKRCGIETLTALQRRILALLEEAGQENVSTLLNSTGTHVGAPEEVDAIGDALSGLVKCGLIEMATSRNRSTLRWIGLPKQESLEQVELKELRAVLRWSVMEKIWKWDDRVPRTQVLLTDEGRVASHKILSEDGYPT